ncbi:hypothetical protein GBA52_014473 [Prunus armeniaca]|nr:hypothetical protein GBA52_014473 [Prunus armeniaca]
MRTASYPCQAVTGGELKWLDDEGFIWLSCIPRKWFQDQLNGCSRVNASFASDRGGLYAKMYGFRPVYHYEDKFTFFLETKETNDQRYHDGGEGKAGPSSRSESDSSMQDPLLKSMEGIQGPKLNKDKGKQVLE